MVASIHRLCAVVVIVGLLLLGLWQVVPGAAAPLPDEGNPTFLTPMTLPPLPETCGGTLPPPCCLHGYIILDGQPLTGAQVTIASEGGSSVVTTGVITDSGNPYPYYSLPLNVEVGAMITVTARYTDMLASTVYRVSRNGGHVVNLSFDSTTRVVLGEQSATQGNLFEPYTVRLSGDGRMVVMVTDNALVPTDTNGVTDTLIYDRLTGRTKLVSVSSEREVGNGPSGSPAISSNGRTVVFASTATNLAPPASGSQIYLHNRDTATTSLVSVAPDGSPGNGGALGPTVSDDGQYVAFTSAATNLVAGDTEGWWDVFVYDTERQQTERVSLASDGTAANHGDFWMTADLSGNGQVVAFTSLADNLTSDETYGKQNIFVRERLTSSTTRISQSYNGDPVDGNSSAPRLSRDGRYVAFLSAATNLVIGDTNGRTDAFLHDRQSGETIRVSVGLSGAEPDISVGFLDLSADGRYVGFSTYASNLVSQDTNGAFDTFVYDRLTGHLRRVSLAWNEGQGNGDSIGPSLSDNGQVVAFGSKASNLVSGDANEQIDIFVRELPPQRWTMMFYLAGDNDLSALLNKEPELRSLAGQRNTTLLLLSDGRGVGDTTRYHIQPNGAYHADTTRWAMGELDMGRASVLRDFVSWGLENHPADHYYLAIANHGRGTQGIAWDGAGGWEDPDTPASFLSVAEMRWALTEATSPWQAHIDVLHLDACLMAMLEVASDASVYADYLVASENLAWGTFAFREYASMALLEPTPREMAQRIAERYHTLQPFYQPHTISAIDLAQINPLRQQLDGLLATLDPADGETITALLTALTKAQRFDSRGYGAIDSEDEYVDLYDWADNLAQASAQANIRTQAQAVMMGVQQAVVAEYHRSGVPHTGTHFWDLERSRGLAIYLPPGADGFDYEPYIENQLFAFTEHSRWDEFLVQLFAAAQLPPAPREAPGVPPVGEHRPPTRLFLPTIQH